MDDPILLWSRSRGNRANARAGSILWMEMGIGFISVSGSEWLFKLIFQTGEANLWFYRDTRQGPARMCGADFWQLKQRIIASMPPALAEWQGVFGLTIDLRRRLATSEGGRRLGAQGKEALDQNPRLARRSKIMPMIWKAKLGNQTIKYGL